MHRTHVGDLHQALTLFAVEGAAKRDRAGEAIRRRFAKGPLVGHLYVHSANRPAFAFGVDPERHRRAGGQACGDEVVRRGTEIQPARLDRLVGHQPQRASADENLQAAVAAVVGGGGAIGLKTQLTGLTQVIWLRKGQGQDDLIIEVTPGYRYDADNVTQLALEPIVVQISGGLYQRDFERVSAWAMANRDLIDDVWDGTVTSLEDVNERVKKVPAPGWR